MRRRAGRLSGFACPNGTSKGFPYKNDDREAVKTVAQAFLEAELAKVARLAKVASQELVEPQAKFASPELVLSSQEVFDSPVE